MASGLFAEAMPDITVAGLNVRYKVYPEKKKKPKIKYCIGFDEDSPTPERDWDQFRSDKDPEAAVRDAVESATSADSASQLQGVSQPIGRRELASLDELNHAADGPALQPGCGVLPSSRRSESASRRLGLRGSSGRLRRLLLAGSHARQTRKLVLRVSSCRSSRTIVERWSLPRSCTTRESSSMRLRTPVFLQQWPKWLRCRISRLAVGWRPLPKQP